MPKDFFDVNDRTNPQMLKELLKIAPRSPMSARVRSIGLILILRH